MNRSVLSGNLVTDSVDLLLMLNIADVNRDVANQLANLFAPLIAANDVNDLRTGFGQYLPNVRGYAFSIRHAE